MCPSYSMAGSVWDCQHAQRCWCMWLHTGAVQTLWEILHCKLTGEKIPCCTMELNLCISLDVLDWCSTNWATFPPHRTLHWCHRHWPTNYLIQVSPQQNYLIQVSPQQTYLIAVSPQQNCLIAVSPQQNCLIAVSPQQNYLIPVSPQQNCLIPVSPQQNCLIPVSPQQNCLTPVSPQQNYLIPLSKAAQNSKAKSQIIWTTFFQFHGTISLEFSAGHSKKCTNTVSIQIAAKNLLVCTGLPVESEEICVCVCGSWM